jgi:adenine-specific DNA-methyltransferase
VFGKDETEPPQLRRYLKDAAAALRSVIVIPGRNGSDTLNTLIPHGSERYPHPKPVELLTLLLGAAGDIDSLILDPFAGSGTTGHAVLRLNARDAGVRRFIMIEEGDKDDRYCRTITAPRIRAAIEKEHLPGGFQFESLGRRLDRDAIVNLEREAITNLIMQTDATGRGRGLTKVDGEYVIAQNPRREAICLCWQGRAKSTITHETLVAMYEEAKELGLRRPLRVYGSTCDVGETESFKFCQIPDEILAALQLDDDDPTPEDDPEVIERLEAATLTTADAGG